MYNLIICLCFVLREKDPQRSSKILQSLRKYLSSLPFHFQNASIITGQQEGLYGWVTVNYLMGNFLEVRICYRSICCLYVFNKPSCCVTLHLQKNLWNTYVRPAGAQTVGSMDLGGASTQIAFAVDSNLTGPDYMHVKLYGYPYNVYTHSYLCYGKNEAEKRVLHKVIQVLSFFVFCICV